MRPDWVLLIPAFLSGVIIPPEAQDSQPSFGLRWREVEQHPVQ
jgi:hypothetical protein